jgi:hypothetical protein
MPTYDHRGYVVTVFASYHVDDMYEWFPGQSTPIGMAIASPDILVPHEWEISLARSGRAAEYSLTVDWAYRRQLVVDDLFTAFMIVEDGQVIRMPDTQ